MNTLNALLARAILKGVHLLILVVMVVGMIRGSRG
jgi:hypothetical protein